MAAQLTDSDRALMRLLHENGRAPFTEIARELGISAKTARKRATDLLDREVIQIVTITDPQLLGYEAMAMVGLRLDHSRPASAVAADLAAIDVVDYVIVVTGRFNLLVELLATDAQELAKVLQREVLAVKGIAGSEVFPYLRFEYQEPRFLAARAGRVPVPSDRSVDDMDRAILAELSEDGRAPFQGIARTLGISEAQVRQRVSGMIESGATRILALANPASLGFRVSAWISCTALPGASVTDLARQIAALPAVTYVVVVAGRFDVFAEAVCVDERDLLALREEHLRSLEGLARLEVAVQLELLYRIFAPPARGSRPTGKFVRASNPGREEIPKSTFKEED